MNQSGLLSVALSLGSPPPGITRHRISMEPGLSSTSIKGDRGHPAVWHVQYSLMASDQANEEVWRMFPDRQHRHISVGANDVGKR